MPQMRALKSHSWNAGTVTRGQTYEATEQEARLLTALGWATQTLAGYERSDLHAHERTGITPQPGDINAPRGTNRAERRKYQRTDMRAES